MSLPDRTREVTPAPSNPDVQKILNAIPHVQRGTGGVVAILKDGKVVGQRAWGYANLDSRIPMTSRTAFPICSISKQMVCLTMVSLMRKPTAVMLESKEDPAKLFDAELKKLLPDLVKSKEGDQLTVPDLYNMQSGIRDYWAMTTLWGARPDGPFSILHDAPQALERTKSFHFSPGTEYSYSNVNFHILGRILENVSGMSLAQLLSERLFVPAGMTTAALCPNTNGLPLPVVGYEGDEKVGYFAATNRIEWAGDAGIAASLEDMIAYEKYLDSSLLDPESIYAETSKQQKYRDGTLAAYGYGLGHGQVAGRKIISHGGALRGFRHSRVQVPSERLNVVLMLNYEVNPGTVAEYVLHQMLGHKVPELEVFTPGPEWIGEYWDPDTLLYVTVGPADKPGKLSVKYAGAEEVVTLLTKTSAGCTGMKVILQGDVLHVERVTDNRILKAKRLTPVDDVAVSADYVGTYKCAEADTILTVTGEDGTLYGSFDGFLGKGPIWLMRRVSKDIWALGNPRGMDAGAPGDWTVVFERGAYAGKVYGCTVGCWLARKVQYERA